MIARHLIILLLFFPFSTFAQYSDDIKTLDTYVKKGMKDWQVPGLSIAVVKDGKVLFSKGYGVTDIDSKNKATSESRFMIGSTTKAMTALGLAILVDEGKLKWDDKVVDLYSEFQLHDAYATRDMTIVDLLSHRGGLGNTDFLWSLNDISSEEIVSRLKYVEPSYPIRGGYTYQNIMYLVAGMVIEKVSGQKWADFIQERLLTPLGMSNSRPLFSDVNGESDYAKPHYLIDEKVQIIPFLTADKVAPAGSIWSTSDDMSKWMLMMLDSGSYQGKRIVSTERVAEVWGTYNIIPQEQFYPTTRITKPNWITYGLGWFQHDYKGYKLQFHTGSLPGLTAIIGLLPERDFGVYVFGNLDHAELRHALMYKAMDLFLDLGDTDWNKAFLNLYAELDQQNGEATKEQFNNQISGTEPSLPLSAYVGTYTDRLYGTAVITQEGNNLRVKFTEQFEAILSHWHYDTFKANWSLAYASPNLMSFELNSEGQVARLTFGNFSLAKSKQ